MDDPDVILIQQTLSRDDMLGLIAACDAVISLHRSEGLGLLVAEAMVLGKPVISTDFGHYGASNSGDWISCRLYAYSSRSWSLPVSRGPALGRCRHQHAAWQMNVVYAGVAL